MSRNDTSLTMTKGKGTKRSKVKSIGLATLVVSVVLCAFPICYFWHNAGVYENNVGVGRYAVLKSMLLLLGGSTSYSLVSGRETVVLTYITPDASSLNDYMSKNGWKRQYQMGAVFYYLKGTKSMEVQQFSFTRYFKINKLQFNP